MPLAIPSNKPELIQFLRDLANALESDGLQYNGCQVMQHLEHKILPDGESAREASQMEMELRVAVEHDRHYKLFRDFINS